MADAIPVSSLSIWKPIHLGTDETGQQVCVNLAERNMLIGGEPGGGKSVALQLIVAHAALAADCRLILIDGKGAVHDLPGPVHMRPPLLLRQLAQPCEIAGVESLLPKDRLDRRLCLLALSSRDEVIVRAAEFVLRLADTIFRRRRVNASKDGLLSRGRTKARDSCDSCRPPAASRRPTQSDRSRRTVGGKDLENL